MRRKKRLGGTVSVSIAGTCPTRGPPAVKQRRREGCGLLDSLIRKTRKNLPSRSSVCEDRTPRVRFACRVCCPVWLAIGTGEGLRRVVAPHRNLRPVSKTGGGAPSRSSLPPVPLSERLRGGTEAARHLPSATSTRLPCSAVVLKPWCSHTPS